MANQLETLFFIGRPFGPIYSLVMKTREKLYKKNIFKQEDAGVPVISVGNLVLGGSGKTPIVSHLAKMLQKNGFTPCIVSRGYGGMAKNPVNVVSDGNKVLMRPEDAGDEPVMHAQKLNGIPVLTGTKRIAPCRHAVSHLGVDIIILDDGFQHMGVKRDVNIVLFDSTTLAGNSRIFPGGPLREPVSALHRSSAFLLTGRTGENENRSNSFRELLHSRFPTTPCFYSEYDKPSFFDANGVQQKTSDIENAFLFCGIAGPERFFSLAKSAGISVSGTLALKDHSRYTDATIKKISLAAKAKGATHIITTEKDFVKLKNYKFPSQLLILKAEQNPGLDFDNFILEQLPNRSL